MARAVGEERVSARQDARRVERAHAARYGLEPRSVAREDDADSTPQASLGLIGVPRARF